MAKLDMHAVFDRLDLVRDRPGLPDADQLALEAAYRAFDGACIHGIADGLDGLAATLDKLVTAAEQHLNILPD